MIVTILEKSIPWTKEEVGQLVQNSMEIEQMKNKPCRIVIMGSASKKPIADILGHKDFTERQADYYQRWG